MRITKFRFITSALLLLLLGGAAVYFLLQHEPDFYRRAEIPAGQKRCDMSNQFLTREFADFVGNFKAGLNQWQSRFNQDRLNAFFEEDFVRFGDADHFRKLGITNPRLEFTPDQIRFGFRFGGESWSTILSYDLKVWVVPHEPNVLAIEILRRRAGALPIPTQQVFQEIKEIAKKHDIDVEWYRHNGNPVAIVKLQPDRPDRQRDRSRTTAHIQMVKIGNGNLEIFGITLDPGQSQIEEIRNAPAAADGGSKGQ